MSDERCPLSVSAALTRRIREGDTAAETDLVVRYRAALTMMLRRQVGDAALAEDLCQEVFRIALPALRAGRLHDQEKLAGYLWGIARHLASQATRCRQRDMRAAAAAWYAAADKAPEPDRELFARERASLVRRALARLNLRDRRVLEAVYFAETPREVICRRIGVTAAQFAVIKHRALKRLRKVTNALGRK